jgi:hypothetical protein
MCLQRTLSCLSHLPYLFDRISIHYLLFYFTKLYKRVHIMAKFNFALFLVALSLGEILENSVFFFV